MTGNMITQINCGIIIYQFRLKRKIGISQSHLNGMLWSNPHILKVKLKFFPTLITALQQRYTIRQTIISLVRMDCGEVAHYALMSTLFLPITQSHFLSRIDCYFMYKEQWNGWNLPPTTDW